MKAFTITSYGKNVALKACEVTIPEVEEHEVLIEIHAAGINVLDAKIRDGEFKLILPYKLPLILGHDVAGIVVKLGSQVQRFKIGDAVYARAADHRIGTFAEFISLNENDVSLKPKNFTMAEAASIPLVGLTVWQALIEKAKLKKGQKIFIQAGSGGVGSFAIQLAKYIGATVATTTGTDNIEWVSRLGADAVIDYKKDDFETMLSEFDVVLHSQDSETLKKSLQILKPGGQLISISGPPDPAFADTIGAPWFVKLIMRLLSFGVRRKATQLGVNFSFLFMRANGKQLTEITKLIDAGVIHPVIDRIFPFEQTNEAVTYVQQGRAKGKVIIKVK